MDGLPAEAMGAAQVQGRTLDWQTAARRLIERLAARAVGPSKRSQEE
jgi:hypothetical protein